MINILLYELKKYNEIRFNTKVSLLVENTLLNKEKSSLDKLSNNFVNNSNEILLLTKDNKIVLPNSNLYVIASIVSWYSTSELELERQFNEVINNFDLNDLSIEYIKKLSYLIYYLKKNLSNSFIDNYILNNNFNNVIKKAYTLFKELGNNINNYYYEDTEDVNILLNIFTYAYYKYIPNELVLYVLNNIKDPYLYKIVIKYLDITDYISVICENVTNETKYIGVKYKRTGTDFIDFYHSKDIKVLSNFLLFEDISNQFYFASEDCLSQDYLDSRDIESFYETQNICLLYTKSDLFKKLINLSKRFINCNNVNEFKECLSEFNLIEEKLETEYEYIFFDSPNEVIMYIQNKYNTEIEVDNNLKNFCSKI